MAHSNVDAIYAEYPFLSRLRSREKVNDAKVRRWDDDFLQTSTTNIYLLDEHGEVVVQPSSPWSDFGKIALFFSVLRSIDESVDNMLRRLSDEKLRRVKYAVGFYSGEGLILWKLPRDHKNAADWQQSTVARTREALRQS